jgi:hypothetical protein
VDLIGPWTTTTTTTTAPNDLLLIMSSSSSFNDSNAAGNDNPRSIGIVSPVAAAAAAVAVPNLVPDTDETRRPRAISPQNRSYCGGEIAATGGGDPFSPLATTPRDFMSTPYSNTATGPNSASNNSKNLFDCPPQPQSFSSPPASQ